MVVVVTVLREMVLMVAGQVVGDRQRQWKFWKSCKDIIKFTLVKKTKNNG